MYNYLDFEKPISDLEAKIHELKTLAGEDESIDTADEIARLEARAREAMADIYARLSPWQKTQVARHPEPSALSRLRRARCSRSSRRSPATASSPRTRPSRPASAASAASPLP